MYDLPGLATHNFNTYDMNNYNYLDPNNPLLLTQNPLYNMVCTSRGEDRKNKEGLKGKIKKDNKRGKSVETVLITIIEPLPHNNA